MAAQDTADAPASFDLVDFAGALLRLRRERGLSQAKLAEHLQVAASTVSRLERGRLPPSAALAQRIGFALSLEPRLRAWFEELAAMARLLHATRDEIPYWRGAQNLLDWLHAQRAQVRSRKEDAPM